MKARNDQMVLCPCCGREREGMPRGHVYLVMGEKSEPEGERKQLGYITRAAALKEFGEENCYFSESDALCPICSALLMKEVEINMFGD